MFVPALLTGNAVLYKPSEFATLTGLQIAGCCTRRACPSDVFVTVVGGGEVGAALLEQPRRRRVLHRLVRDRRSASPQRSARA